MNIAIPPSLQQLTVSFAILGALFCIIRHWSDPRGRSLEAVIRKLLSASSIPTGIMLLGCGLFGDTSILATVGDLGLYLAAAGVALLFISIKELLH